MEFLSIIPAVALGYLTLRVTTHPNSKFRKKLPNIKTSRIQVFPVIRFYFFGRVIHLHHWFNFSILLLLSLFLNAGFLDFTITQGILIGGVLHGLSLPKEHRKMVYRDFSLERLTSISKS